jgi:hypothetical protein
VQCSTPLFADRTSSDLLQHDPGKTHSSDLFDEPRFLQLGNMRSGTLCECHGYTEYTSLGSFGQNADCLIQSNPIQRFCTLYCPAAPPSNLGSDDIKGPLRKREEDPLHPPRRPNERWVADHTRDDTRIAQRRTRGSQHTR